MIKILIILGCLFGEASITQILLATQYNNRGRVGFKIALYKQAGQAQIIITNLLSANGCRNAIHREGAIFLVKSRPILTKSISIRILNQINYS